MERNSIIRMRDFPTVWENNCPDTLFDITIKFCLNHPCTLFDFNPATLQYELREGISLHREICHRMIELTPLDLSNGTEIRRVISLFKNPIRTRLTSVDLSYTLITDKEVEIICRHPITDLKLYACPQISGISREYINRLKSTLSSLDIGHTCVLMPEVTEVGVIIPEPSEEEIAQRPLDEFMLPAPKMCRLGLENSVMLRQVRSFQYFVQMMPNLTHLDLSRCENIFDLSCLANSTQLVSLILFNVTNVKLCFPAIFTLKSLRHLDVSSDVGRHISFDSPNCILRTLIESLENLESLDISGTNLAGNRVQERTFPPNDTTHDPRYLGSRLKEARAEHKPTELEVTDIPGLISRVGRPLEYLGLYNTAFDACYRHHIPAKRIGGEANEDQILTAAQIHITRVEIIQKILNDLFHVFRFSICTDVQLALDVVLHAMRLHMQEKQIQISGSASLFYIVKGEEKERFHYKIKRKIIKTLLDAMFEHILDVTMLRNGCLSLIHFKIPEDVFFEYERLVSLLLTVVSTTDHDEFIQRVGVYLLNSLACQVDNSHKLLMGNAGAISIMLQLISNRLEHKLCDEVMETAWSSLWNVTDETPVNCERFLNEDGMLLFLGCLKEFPGKPELLRNMMGLLGNVAEVKELRPRLMKDEYLVVFSELLDSKSDGIEVSYNAAGILSHIASDGPELWEQHGISAVKRQDVLNRMVAAINSWDLKAKRNINYRSFEPILRLLSVDHTPEAQLWAVWALANLTKVYPGKYCAVLREEGGLDMIFNLRHHRNVHIMELVKTILCQYTKYTYPNKDQDIDIA